MCVLLLWMQRARPDRGCVCVTRAQQFLVGLTPVFHCVTMGFIFQVVWMKQHRYQTFISSHALFHSTLLFGGEQVILSVNELLEWNKSRANKKDNR